MLIRNAEIDFGTLADVRIDAGFVAEIGVGLARGPGEAVIEAGGNALLPGLHDHHIHLLAFAASLDSVACGPPAVRCEADLIEALQARRADNPSDWIRGIGYHESVAGDIDRDWLDRIAGRGPMRIQHRSGRLWILNSAALDLVAGGPDDPLETIDGRVTGRLYDADRWLRAKLGGNRPDIARASTFLASRGVTGLTDTTHTNGPDELALFGEAQSSGALIQDIVMMGSAAMPAEVGKPGLRIGALKLHLHDANLPDFEQTCAAIRASHEAGRPVAAHCTTLGELVFALGALREAGAIPGNRIEHAGVAPPDVLPLMAELGVTVVTQPNFIAERGDAYLADVDPADQPWLYRLRGLRDAGIPIAAGTDAPFGNTDPWRAMAAAVSRRTVAGAVIGKNEALLPEEALSLFLGALDTPGGRPRKIAVGAPADLCLLDRPWAQARSDLAQVAVQATIKSGRIVWPVSR
jgi:predicted amidohydrolase YtcJ